MQRTISVTVIVGALVAVGGLALVYGEARMMRHHIKDLPEARVRLTPAAPAAEAAPFAVRLENGGDQAIVGYSISWSWTGEGGAPVRTHTLPIINLTAVYDPQNVRGDDRAPLIEPGTSRVLHLLPDTGVGVATSFGHGRASAPTTPEEAAERARDELASVVHASAEVTVAIDWVLFKDGTTVGPGADAFVDHEGARLAAERELYTELVAEADRGGSIRPLLEEARAAGSASTRGKQPEAFRSDPVYLRGLVALRYLDYAESFGEEIAVKMARQQLERGFLTQLWLWSWPVPSPRITLPPAGLMSRPTKHCRIYA